MNSFWVGYLVGVFSVIGTLFILGILGFIGESMHISELEADEGTKTNGK
jgi:hypothetical protein